MFTELLARLRPRPVAVVLLLAVFLLAACGQGAAPGPRVGESGGESAGDLPVSGRSGGTSGEEGVGEPPTEEPSGSDDSGGESGEDGGRDFTPQNLDVLLGGLEEGMTLCHWQEIVLDVFVFFGDRAAYRDFEFNFASAALGEELFDESGEQVSVDPVMVWTITLSGGGNSLQSGPTVTGPKDHHQETFSLLEFEGEVTARATVEAYLVGPDWRKLYASGEDAVTFEVRRCPYDVEINFEGEFQDGPWTRQESATMAPVRIEASPGGEYSGEGQLQIVGNQQGTMGGGECHTTAPWTGSIDVSITGDINPESGELTLEFDFASGQVGGAQMTCSAEGVSMTTGAAGGPVDTGAWPLANLNVPVAGGTESFSVGQGLSGAPGSGQLNVIIEPVEEEATS